MNTMQIIISFPFLTLLQLQSQFPPHPPLQQQLQQAQQLQLQHSLSPIANDINKFMQKYKKI